MIGPDIINSIIQKEPVESLGKPDLKPLSDGWKPPKDLRISGDSADEWKPPKDIRISADSADEWKPPKDIQISGDSADEWSTTDDKDASPDSSEKTKCKKNPDVVEQNAEDSENPQNETTDKTENQNDANEQTQEDDNPEDPVKKKIEDSLNTPEGLQKLLERHPELAERLQEIIDILNDPDATPAEKRSAQTRLNQLKGQLLEAAVKDALADAGLDVDDKQKQQDGENGKTKPDVVATNNTDHPITVLGVTLQPGESISIECKCGQAGYLKSELANHIPNQLSGQEGHRVLLTTSDVKALPSGTAESVCDKYNANLVVLDISVKDVDNALMNR